MPITQAVRTANARALASASVEADRERGEPGGRDERVGLLRTSVTGEGRAYERGLVARLRDVRA
jgi:hypothetical protein